MNERQMADLVESVATKCFGGTLPARAEVIAIALTVTVWPIEEASAELTAEFFAECLSHVRAYLDAQRATETAKFKN